MKSRRRANLRKTKSRVVKRRKRPKNCLLRKVRKKVKRSRIRVKMRKPTRSQAKMSQRQRS